MRRWINAICVDCGALVNVCLLPLTGKQRGLNGEVFSKGWRPAAVRDSPRRPHDCEHARQTCVHAYFLSPAEIMKVRRGQKLAVQVIARDALRMRLVMEEARW